MIKSKNSKQGRDKLYQSGKMIIILMAHVFWTTKMADRCQLRFKNMQFIKTNNNPMILSSEIRFFMIISYIIVLAIRLTQISIPAVYSNILIPEQGYV
jgi:hypothetical protein